MKRRTYRVLALGAIGLLVGSVGTGLMGSAVAAETPDLSSQTWVDGTATKTGTEPVCTIEAVTLEPGQNPDLMEGNPEVCFDNAAQALTYITGIPVAESQVVGKTGAEISKLADEVNKQADAQLAAAVQGGSSAASINGAAANSPVDLKNHRVLGLIYEKTSYYGNFKMMWGRTTVGCRGVTFGFPKLSPYLWNGKTRSADAMVNCWVTLYDVDYYKGDRINCKPGCASMGAMDRRSSSIVYRPRGTTG